MKQKNNKVTVIKEQGEAKSHRERCLAFMFIPVSV